MEKITMYTDGGARGNPGPAGIGVVIAHEGNVVSELSVYIGEQTNNFAEYEALIRGLKEIERLFSSKLSQCAVEIFMDSELVVRQIGGQYKVKEPSLKEKFSEVQVLLRRIPNTTFTHVRREKNRRADELVNEAIDARG
jgi:ribonuclease HI